MVQVLERLASFLSSSSRGLIPWAISFCSFSICFRESSIICFTCSLVKSCVLTLVAVKSSLIRETNETKRILFSKNLLIKQNFLANFLN